MTTIAVALVVSALILRRALAALAREYRLYRLALAAHTHALGRERAERDAAEAKLAGLLARAAVPAWYCAVGRN